MDTYTSSVTPRLRVTRNPSIYYDRSQIASTSEGGPSRLPEFSQLVDVNLNDMGMSVTSEQPSTASTAQALSTSTRSENPAAVLRALLSRLPTQPKSPARTRSPSQQYLSERESDYDMDLTEPAKPSHAPSTSSAQESLKDIFSKARGETSTVSQRELTRRSSFDASDIDSSVQVQGNRTDDKSRRRSLSDDGMDNIKSIPRPSGRSKVSSQPVTMEFLRERFSDRAHASFEQHSPPVTNNSSNDTATILRDLDSMQGAATSTPVHSLRMSFNSQFQSNLLDQDSEMQHAIDELDSYGEGSGRDRSVSPPPVLRKRPTSRTESHRPISSNLVHDSSKTPTAALYRSSQQTRRSVYDSTNNDEMDDSFSLNRAMGSERKKSRTSPEALESDRSDIENDQISGRKQFPKETGSRISRQHSNSEEISQFITSQKSQERQNVHSNQSAVSNGPHIIANGQRSVSLSRASSPSASSATSHGGPSREQPWNSSPGSSRRSRTPVFDAVTPQPSVARHVKNESPRSVDQSQEQDYSNNRRSTTPVDSPNISQGTRYKESSKLQSPTPPDFPSSSPGPSASLRVIDNTYHNEPSLRHPPRTSSPHSFSEKGSSFTTPKISKPSIWSNSQPVATPSIKEEEAQSKPTPLSSRSRFSQQTEMPRSSTPRASTTAQFTPSPPWSPVDDVPKSSRRRANGHETDELRETDFSSQSETPRMRTVAPPDTSDDQEHHSFSRKSLAQHSTHPSAPQATPRVLVDDHTPPLNSFEDVVLTPPRMSTPKDSRRDPKSPSSSINLPELPSPSSSDEFEPQKYDVTPRTGHGRQEASWMPTPKPPGGWLQTPAPRTATSRSTNVFNESTVEREAESDDAAALDPKTPLRRTSPVNTPFTAKTPKFPGAWQTPAPASSVQTWSAEQESSGQAQGLMTPAASLSKGSTLDPKTPYVPGGWAATPAGRKSILKVRFNKEENEDASSQLSHSGTTNDTTQREGASGLTRSPTRNRRSIRVLDAFGREESSLSEVANDNRSKSMLRVVDAMGREVQESQAEDIKVEEDFPPTSRRELLSRIRRGLDNLVEDIDDIDSDITAQADDDKTRMEQLKAVSRQAREHRARLQDESAKLRRKVGSDKLSDSFVLPSRFGPRFYIVLLCIQVVFVLLMYRLSVIRAKELFFNAYYDPFNRDLHLYLFKYDNSFRYLDADISGVSWRSFAATLLRKAGGQHNWLHFGDELRTYFFKFWDGGDAQKITSWSPT